MAEMVAKWIELNTELNIDKTDASEQDSNNALIWFRKYAPDAMTV